MKNLLKEIMPVEKPILGNFCEILPFLTGNKLVTKPIFQSNSTTVVWLMYRGKGFVLNVIGIEALLPTYCLLKTHFLPLWIENGLPLGAKWPRYTTKWINWRGAIISHKITYIKSIQSNRGQVHIRT